MKICRFRPVEHSDQPQANPRYGLVEGAVVHEIRDAFHQNERAGTSWKLAELNLLAPSEPSKIVCVGRNYADHAAEMRNAVPQEPLIFLKPPSATIGPDDPIVLTPESERVDYEGELAIVIGKRCSRLGRSENVRPYILGFTCLNDVTARDLQKKDVQFTRAKGFDTFCPFGPLIETDFDPAAARLRTLVNGKERQSALISEMIFPVDVLIRWISQVMTLLPGDLISTGTPAGVGPLAAGDIVEVDISGIGTLRNPVKDRR